MTAPAASSAAREINRLHAEVDRLAVESKQSLHAALSAAWRAAEILFQPEQPGAAQNYMRLAQNVADVSTLAGMSLRQAYIHLGISTAPKSRGEAVRVPSLPAHVRFATRLVRALHAEPDLGRLPPERLSAFRQDLRPLYDQLRRLFEPAANNPPSGGSKSP